MIKYARLFSLLAVFLSVTYAEKYYVDNTNTLASDSNAGTFDLPWLTINHAADNASQPGDIVYVRAGTYDERVTCSYSGSDQGGYITFAGYPGDEKPIMRGFFIRGKRYIRIIGFEITHNSTEYTHGINPYGRDEPCDHIEILDNYIHHVQGHAIRWIMSSNSYITVRGNVMYMAACPDGVSGECKGNGWAVQANGEGYTVIEYNEAHRCGDFCNVHETNTVVRNNYFHDFKNEYWPDGPGDNLHCDMFQPCGSSGSPSQYQVYESNFMGDNVEANSHILQMRRTQGDDDHHIIFRGNVGYNHGSYAMQCGGIDYVYYYNNTIHDINNVNGSNSATGYNAEGTNYATNNHNFNNIYSDIGTGRPIYVATGCSCVTSDNVCFETGDHESCESTDDPLYVNSGSHNFHLQSGSPAINLGKAITTVTTANGSGTSFDVADAGFFCDGYGLVDGDLIKIGSNDPVKIVSISSNTITVSSSITWNSGDGVYWRHQDTSPDAGAYEYRPGGYDYDIAISSPVNDQNVNGSVNITTTPTNQDCIRYVMFYIDGIPVAMDTESPHSYTWDVSSEPEGSRHTIESRAYALYATKSLMKSDTVHVIVSNTSINVSKEMIGNGLSILFRQCSGKCIIWIIKNDPLMYLKEKMRIYTPSGILINELDGDNGEFIWDTKSVSNGIYLMCLKGSQNLFVQRMYLMR